MIYYSGGIPMDYSIENELIRLTVTTSGAQVKSVKRK